MTLHHTYIYIEGGQVVGINMSIADVKSALIDAQRANDWAEFLIDETTGEIFHVKPFSVIALKSSIVTESPITP